MTTPEDNANCYHMQNDPHRCKIKPERFHCDILWCYEFIKESFRGGLPPPQGKVGPWH